MNKLLKISIFSAMILALSAVFFSAMALNGNPTQSPVKSVEDVMKILTSIVNVLYTAFFIVAIGFVILAAFDYLTGVDNPEKIKSATHKIIYAAIAIAIALVSVGANTIIETFIK